MISPVIRKTRVVNCDLPAEDVDVADYDQDAYSQIIINGGLSDIPSDF